MHYVCVENEQIVSVLNYEPSVPDSVSVYEISDDDHKLLSDRTHYFDILEKVVKVQPNDVTSKLNLEKEKQDVKSKLAASDYKVLRHIREKALGLPTTLSEKEYIALETQRQKWADFINQ